MDAAELRIARTLAGQISDARPATREHLESEALGVLRNSRRPPETHPRGSQEGHCIENDTTEKVDNFTNPMTLATRFWPLDGNLLTLKSI